MENIDLDMGLKEFQKVFSDLESEVNKVIVGNENIIRYTLIAFLAGGHVLLEGVPGLGKTLLVKTLSNCLGLSFKRIQFTPDLMPADLTGTDVLTEDESGKRSFVFKRGPLFANIVLADEINRATPKTQSALLESMEEKQITVLGNTYVLEPPFFVMATQNPVELEGTYPLPEAQLDRFLIKLLLQAPGSKDLKTILSRTTGNEIPVASQILSDQVATGKIDYMKKVVRAVTIADPLQEVLVRMVLALSPESEFATPKVKKYVRFGSGPRGAQAVMLTSKVLALLNGRINVALEDLKQALLPCLRHRIILNFQAQADDVSTDDLIKEIQNAK